MSYAVAICRDQPTNCFPIDLSVNVLDYFIQILELNMTIMVYNKSLGSDITPNKKKKKLGPSAQIFSRVAILKIGEFRSKNSQKS